MAIAISFNRFFFVLIKDFPITAWNDWLKSHWDLASLLNTMANNSFGLMALVTIFLGLLIVWQNLMIQTDPLREY